MIMAFTEENYKALGVHKGGQLTFPSARQHRADLTEILYQFQ